MRPMALPSHLPLAVAIVALFTPTADGAVNYWSATSWPEGFRTATNYSAGNATITFFTTFVSEGDLVYLVHADSVDCNGTASLGFTAPNAVYGSGVGAKVVLRTYGLPVGTYYMCQSQNGGDSYVRQ
eukprot:Sspe_Gene.71320::Locus_42245_Transcript_1_1_Confidence_1.000_Length_411::g.71320::m.71320